MCCGATAARSERVGDARSEPAHARARRARGDIEECQTKNNVEVVRENQKRPQEILPT